MGEAGGENLESGLSLLPPPPRGGAFTVGLATALQGPTVTPPCPTLSLCRPQGGPCLHVCVCVGGNRAISGRN